MNTAETQSAGTDPQVLADLDAVLKQITEGVPVDPETARRIEQRAGRVTEELRRRDVRIDVEQLLRDARDEA